MVDMKVTLMMPNDRRHDRLQRLRDAAPKPVIRVEPNAVEGKWTEDDMRRVMRHPTRGSGRGIGFPPGGGSVEWPLDAFTRRRIAEGAIKVAEDDPSGGKGTVSGRLQQRRSSAPSSTDS